MDLRTNLQETSVAKASNVLFVLGKEGDSDMNSNIKRDHRCMDMRRTETVGGQPQPTYLVLPKAEVDVARAPLKKSKNRQEGIINENIEQERSSDMSSIGPSKSRNPQEDIIHGGPEQAGSSDESCRIGSCVTKDQIRPVRPLEQEQGSDDDDGDDGHQFDIRGWQIQDDVQSSNAEENVSESKRPTSYSNGEQERESLEDMEKVPSANTCTSNEPEDKLKGHQPKKYQMTTEIKASRSRTGDGIEISATIQSLSGTTGGKPLGSSMKRSAFGTNGEREVKLIACNDKLSALVVKQHLEGIAPLQDVGKLARTIDKSPSGDQDLNIVDNPTVKVPDENDGVSTAARNETLELSYKCHKCHSYFDTLHQLLEHIHGRNGKCHRRRCVTEELQCKECGKCCSRSDMPRHMMSHTGEWPFTCEYCGKGFTMKTYLTKHVMRMHNEEKPCLCQYCGKGYTHQYLLNQHITIHTGEMKYRCQECGKAIRTYQGYVQHLKTHAKVHDSKLPSQNQKPTILCQICGKLFKTQGNLDSHLLIHSDVKGFKCDICNKAFRHRLSLKFHKQVHAGDRPYVCAICKYAFFTLTSLKSHERTHRGTKLFKCPQCDISFSNKYSLNLHSETHAETEPHDCHLCKSTFIAKRLLESHLLKFHPEEVKSADTKDART